MTFYASEINRIRAAVYVNQAQIDTVISIRKFIDLHFDTDLMGTVKIAVFNDTCGNNIQIVQKL